MQRKTWLITSLLFVAVGFVAQAGCGPNCAKIITTKSPEDLDYEDALRINDFVKRRAAAMKDAEGGNMYMVEDAKRTVTACEFGIQMMVQVRNLNEAKSPLYEQNLAKINDTRCFLDDVLLSKGKLIGKGKGAVLSSGTANDLRVRLDEFKEMFGEEGTVSERSINAIYKNGVKVKKGKAGKEGEAAAEEGGEGGGVDESGDMSGDEGGSGDEGDAEGDGEGEGDEGGESSSGMDSF